MARVDIHYFEQALQCAVRQGIDRQKVLNDLSIVLTENSRQVDDDQMTRLVQYVWASLADEFLGCTNTPCKRGTFPFMARHILHFSTLGEMLKQAIKFYDLVTDDVNMALSVTGDVAEFEFVFPHPQHDPGYFFREFWLIIWHRFSSWLIDEKIPLTQVVFNYDKPSHHQQLKLLFPCRHKFNGNSIKLTFSAKYLERSAMRSQTSLTAFLRQSPADLITIPGSDSSVTSMVLARLINQDSTVFLCPRFDVMAQSLAMGTQTLRRRLKSENTSYPQIKQQLRHDLALSYLQDGKLTVADIAVRLGFSEPRSFTRAFKQWAGVSPSQYQRSR